MALQEPASMDECIYFTNRTIDSGKAMAWVFRKLCPKCKKSRMGKPINPKTGKVNKKSDLYVCPECSYSENAAEHEANLVLNVKYTCPYCGKSGEATTEYIKKSFEGVPAYVFVCKDCNKNIGITKKMKATKKKGE